DFLVGVVGALEACFVFAGTEREVARLDRTDDFGVALDAALVNKSGDGGEYNRNQRKGDNDGNAEPRMDAHAVQSLGQFLELCDQENQGHKVRGEPTGPGRSQTDRDVDPVAAGRLSRRSRSS